MNLVVSVMENVAKIPALMDDLAAKNINGATVFDSYGMGRILSRAHKNKNNSEELSKILSERRPTNRTIFVVVPDEKLDDTMDVFRRYIVGENNEKLGILFSTKLDKVII